MQTVSGKRVTLAGLGHFGGQIAAARWLVEQGAKVLVTDTSPAERLADAVKQLDGLPIEFHLGGHEVADFTQADLVVASPAIPPHSEFLAVARQAGVPITTEIRLFIERCPATLVGVTGTKGKSTTTALLAEMLKTRFKTFRGGNIGGSLLPDLANIDKTDLVVLELSSYMLHYLGEMHWSPHVSVVTMIAADHLEWHGGAENYRSAKANIVRYQRPDDVAILNETDEPSLALSALTQAQVRLYGVAGRRPLELQIPGVHNQFNAQAALVAAEVLGISFDAAQAAVRNMPGLPHRLQRVHEEEGVQYFNDSIATVPESAIAALRSFPPKRVLQIVGGYDHHLPITEFCNVLIERAKTVLCIGASGPKIAAALAESHSAKAPVVYQCGDVATAVRLAKQQAAAGDIVLLSTGYKSFDQFANYEERGETFARVARQGTE